MSETKPVSWLAITLSAIFNISLLSALLALSLNLLGLIDFNIFTFFGSMGIIFTVSMVARAINTSSYLNRRLLDKSFENEKNK